MKVIDILNKIANGEDNFRFKVGDYAFYKVENGIIWSPIVEKPDEWKITKDRLNEEVEIIEEDKKIEKLDPLQKDWMTLDDIKFTFSNSEMVIVNKINEIIEVLNERDIQRH